MRSCSGSTPRETLASSLDTIGTAMPLAGDEAKGIEYLERSLRMACDARLDDNVSNVYLTLPRATDRQVAAIDAGRLTAKRTGCPRR